MRTLSSSVPMTRAAVAITTGIVRWRARGSSSGTT